MALSEEDRVALRVAQEFANNRKLEDARIAPIFKLAREMEVGGETDLAESIGSVALTIIQRNANTRLSENP